MLPVCVVPPDGSVAEQSTPPSAVAPASIADAPASVSELPDEEEIEERELPVELERVEEDPEGGALDVGVPEDSDVLPTPVLVDPELPSVATELAPGPLPALGEGLFADEHPARARAATLRTRHGRACMAGYPLASILETKSTSPQR